MELTVSVHQVLHQNPKKERKTMYYQYTQMLPGLAEFVPKLGPGHRIPTAKHRCMSCPPNRTGKDHEVSGLDRFKAATHFLPDGHAMTKKERERIVGRFMVEAVRAKVGQDVLQEISETDSEDEN